MGFKRCASCVVSLVRLVGRGCAVAAAPRFRDDCNSTLLFFLGMLNNHFESVVALRSSHARTGRAYGKRAASEEEFSAAMEGRDWGAARREGAYRVLVLGQKVREAADAVGMSLGAVGQAVNAAYAAVERWRLQQLDVAAKDTDVVGRLMGDIERLVARASELADTAEEGELRAVLQKSLVLLRYAADDLRPHAGVRKKKSRRARAL